MNQNIDSGASALENILEAWYSGHRIKALNLADEYQRRFANLIEYLPEDMKSFLVRS